MVKSQIVSITPTIHATSHQVGGTDPLTNPLLLHESRHIAGGADALTKNIWIYENATQVFNANAPNAWTTLDLSAIIGANRALVIIRVHNVDATTAANYRFRTNGALAPDQYGLSYLYLPTGKGNNAMVLTDAAGIVEWTASNAGVDTDAWVLAYCLV